MKALTGTGSIIRLILRRDRIALPAWLGIVTLLGVSVAATFVQGYATPAEIQTVIRETASSPATEALLGPVYAPNVGALVAWRWTMQGVIVLGLFSLFSVIRHTRAEEESGHSELIGSTAIGRLAPLSAALIVIFSADLILGLVVAALLIGLGLPAAGALALGLSVAGASWVAAAAAGAAAQVSEHSGTARGIAAAVFILFYMLRSLGDAGGISTGWLSWLSPFGWARLTRPFAGERWWLFGLFVLATGLFTILAYVLAARRDFGVGLLPSRMGPAAASPGLRSPLALAWRLQRGTLLGWAAGFAVIGALLGLVATTVSNMLTINPSMQNFFDRLGVGTQPGELVLTLFFVAFGPVIAIYAISAVLDLRNQENDGLADPILAAPVSRLRWMSGYLLVAAIGQAIVLAVLGLTSGWAYGLSQGNIVQEIGRVLGAALAYLPAVWLMGAIAAALFGLLPRLTVGSWAALVVVVFLELFWELQQISRTVYDLSPYAHVPRLLVGQGLDWRFFGLIAVAILLVIAGLAGFKRRDVIGN